MIKEVLFGAAGVIAIAAIIAVVRYQMMQKENGEEVESLFVDELNMGELKAWFVDKLEMESTKGVVLLPTKENTEKWKVKMPESDNMLIQIVYDEGADNITAYREIGFSSLSPKLKELLDTNGGTLVIEK